MDRENIIIAFDHGTTFSKACYFDEHENKIKMIKNENDEYLFESVINFQVDHRTQYPCTFGEAGSNGIPYQYYMFEAKKFLGIPFHELP